jgi:phospholipase C
VAQLTRRRMLGLSAAAAGGVIASSLLPPNLRRVLAAGPRKGSIKDIKHVIVHMQENRSFDHYFGTLAGVRGFGDPNAIVQANGKSIFYQPDPQNPDGYLLPWHLDTRTTSSEAIPSTSHAWTVQHSAWNGGLMNNWLPAHLAADGSAHGPYTMSYYERQDIPFQFALAESFTICDGYHCSLLGPTWPNRLYLMSANIDPAGTNGGPIISNVVPSPYTWTTYPERLQQAGISWKVYQEEDDYGTNVLEFFKQYQDAAPGSALYEKALRISQPGQFEEDVRNGTLPTVSWIIPTSEQSEHPAFTPAASADFIASKLDALASNPEIWESSLYILNYDENDGLFDHVPPPVPPPGTPGEFVNGLPIGGGIRVPCILISPWTVGGFVADETFDHTSVLQLLEQVTGVVETNMTAWRRQAFGDLTSALGFTSERAFPPLPATKPEFWQAIYQIENLPAATIPGAQQTPPVQDQIGGVRPEPAPATAQDAPTMTPSGAFPRAARGTTSRLQESRTTHRSDFPQGAAGDTSFPGILASAVERAGTTQSVPTSAYVPALGGGSVAVINAQTYALVQSIGNPTSPYGIAATPDGTKLYVTASGANSVSVLDPATGATTATVVVGPFPHGVAITPDGTKAYVANTGPNTGPGGSNTVSVIDTATNTLAQTVTVGQAPQVPAVTPDGNRVLVTTSDTVWLIDVTAGHGHALPGSVINAHGVAVSPDSRSAYVVDTDHNQLVVLQLPSGQARGSVAVGDTPWNVALSSDGTTAYVTNTNSDTVSVIETASLRVTATIPVGHGPTGITVSGTTVWVTDNTSGAVSAIDTTTNQVTHTIDLGLSTAPSNVVVA